MAETESLYLTSRDIQELLHVHSNTVHRWRKSGKLESVRVGREYRYPAEQIVRLLTKREAAQVVETLDNTQGQIEQTAGGSSLQISGRVLEDGDAVEVLFPTGWERSVLKQREGGEWYLLGLSVRPLGLIARVAPKSVNCE